MNKKIIEALQEYNFTFNGNTGYGKINNYEVNIINNPASNGPVFLFSTYLTLEQKQAFVNILKKSKIKMLVPNYFEFGVLVQIGAMTGNSFKKNFPSTIQVILDTLEMIHAPKDDICPVIGKAFEGDFDYYVEDGMKIKISKEGITSYNEEVVKANEEFEEMPNNYLKGFGGILLGAIIGLVIQFVLSLIGFVSAISALVAIYLGTRFYVKLGGKPNFVMAIMSIATTTIVLLGSLFILYFISASGYCSELGLSLTGVDAFKYALNNVEGFKSGVIYDMLINLLFIIIGAVGSIYSLKKTVNRPKEI